MHTRRFRLHSPAFLSLALALAVISSAFCEEKIAAYVNDEPIPVSSLEKELVRIHTANKVERQRSDFNLDRLVQRLVNNCLLEQEARNIGLDADSSVAGPVAKFRENLAYNSLLGEIAPDSFKATDGEIRQAFDREYASYDLQTLCVSDSATTYALADSIRRGADMDNLARVHSIDKFKANGGRAGYLAVIDIPEPLRQRLEQTQDGGLIGPLPLWKTQAVVRVLGRKKADPARLDSVKSSLQQEIVQSKRDAAVRTFTDRLRAETYISVDSSSLDTLLEHLRLGQPAARRLVAVVGEKMIYESELRNKYIHRASARPDLDARTILLNTLSDQIQSSLLRQAALKQNFGAKEAVATAVKSFEDSLLVDAYLQDVIQSSITITDEEVKAYYDSHRDNFHEPPMLRIATLTRNSEAEAAADYETIKGGADFAWLTRRNSTDDAASTGGVRDWIRGDALALDVYQVLDTLKPGEVSRPTKYDGKWTLIQIVDRREGTIKTLDQVSGGIRAQVERQKQLAAIDKAIQSLRASANIRIMEETIKELRVVGRQE
jgi:parvulin-like peptidyl-prolyl isomerase